MIIIYLISFQEYCCSLFFLPWNMRVGRTAFCESGLILNVEGETIKSSQKEWFSDMMWMFVGGTEWNV